jgi:pyruvate/2-oxoglutarate dehydrogenase complex dihydrolipoamide dehydrogenase (E3) component
VDLAVAAPDKTEVQPVWDYRWQEITEMNIPVKTGVNADTATMRAFNPDYVVVATGSVPRDPPLDTSKVSANIQIMHAWDAFAHPERIAAGARVTVIGGGMVGVEITDLLRLKQCKIQVLEMQATAANGMARNNKFELLERIAADGVRVITKCRIQSLTAHYVEVQIEQAQLTSLEIGEVLIFATGPRANTAVVEDVIALGVPYAQVGDCNAPGDFLTAIRDAWMVGLSIDQHFISGKQA